VPPAAEPEDLVAAESDPAVLAHHLRVTGRRGDTVIGGVVVFAADLDDDACAPPGRSRKSIRYRGSCVPFRELARGVGL
jgi:hypothetical protein